MMVAALVLAFRLGIGWALADPWADELISAHASLNGTGLYNDPTSVLGPPATEVYDPLAGQQRAVTLISPAYNLDGPSGRPVVLTLHQGQFIKVRFDEPVTDDPRNPFGVDLIVFGNAFFLGSGFAWPDTDLETFLLLGTVFAEPVTIAVSASGVGDPQTHPAEWYVYVAGPLADGLLPTNAFDWDRALHELGAPTDFTLPADPALTNDDFASVSAADAVDKYLCSGGGTGFDIAESGFAEIQFVYLTGSGGEVDALADVFPTLGDFDRDADVDLADVAAFLECFDASIAGRCSCRSGDFDGDGTVSHGDFAVMHPFVGGPGAR